KGSSVGRVRSSHSCTGWCGRGGTGKSSTKTFQWRATCGPAALVEETLRAAKATLYAQRRKLTTRESNTALAVPVPLVVGSAMPILSSEPEGMLSARERDIVHALKSLIGSGE